MSGIWTGWRSVHGYWHKFASFRIFCKPGCVLCTSTIFFVFVFFWLSVCSYFCKMAVLLFCCKFTIFQYVHDYVGLTHRLWKAKANNMCKAAYELIDWCTGSLGVFGVYCTGCLQLIERFCYRHKLLRHVSLWLNYCTNSYIMSFKFYHCLF